MFLGQPANILKVFKVHGTIATLLIRHWLHLTCGQKEILQPVGAFRVITNPT